MLSEGAVEVLQFFHEEATKWPFYRQLQQAKPSVMLDAILKTAPPGVEKFIAEINSNRKEAEQAIAGMLGLM